MSPRRAMIPSRPRARNAQHEELLVRRRGRRGQDITVAFQWRDGAGELHYETLSPAQSWPFLEKR